jgi:antitoxin (DNA-binding transcriptional repressor) of toxin-antitoxin stability system
MTQAYKSDAARMHLRRILEAARAGEDSIIEHYDTPTAAVIPYQDYLALQDELDDLRAGRRAQTAYEAWQRNPRTGRPWAEVRAELAPEPGDNSRIPSGDTVLRERLQEEYEVLPQADRPVLEKAIESIRERYKDRPEFAALLEELAAAVAEARR